MTEHAATQTLNPAPFHRLPLSPAILSPLLRGAIYIAAGLYILAYLYIALSRLTFPFELEWMEGSSLLEVARVVHGQSLYVAPTMDYVPMIYQPLYFYLSAAAALLLGVDFTPLRLISILASLGCFAVIMETVRRETHSAFFGVLATGLFAASFRASGAWFDLGRVDTLFVLFLLMAVFLARRETPAAQALAALAFSLSFLTKQTAALTFAPVLFYCALRNWRHAIILVVTTIAVLSGATVYLRYLYGEWYTYYVFQLPAAHNVALSPNALLACVSADVIAPFAAALTLAICSALLAPAAAAVDLFTLAAVGMITTSVLGKLHAGGYANVLMPAYASIAILCGLAAHRLTAACNDLPSKLLISTAVYVACLVQFAALGYNVRAQLPTERDRATGQKLVSVLREIQGDVYVPYHTYLPVLAGKHEYAHREAFGDIEGRFGGGDPGAWARVRRDIVDAVRDRFDVVILDAVPDWLNVTLAADYEPPRPLLADKSAFRPVTGAPLHPELVYLRKGGRTSTRLAAAGDGNANPDILSALAGGS